jgi:hypothetical protein
MLQNIKKSCVSSVNKGLGRGVKLVCVEKYRLIFHFTRNIYDVYGPQFDTVELDVVSAFENIFDIALVQLIAD